MYLRACSSTIFDRNLRRLHHRVINRVDTLIEQKGITVRTTLSQAALSDELRGKRGRMTRQTSDDRALWIAMIVSSKDPRVIKRGFQRGCTSRAFDATLVQPRF